MTLNRAALGASVAMDPHRIPINVAIAAVLILAIAVAAGFHLSLAELASSRHARQIYVKR